VENCPMAELSLFFFKLPIRKTRIDGTRMHSTTQGKRRIQVYLAVHISSKMTSRNSMPISSTSPKSRLNRLILSSAW
jgi:hypothetical protein